MYHTQLRLFSFVGLNVFYCIYNYTKGCNLLGSRPMLSFVKALNAYFSDIASTITTKAV